MTTATLTAAVYIRKEASGFSITDANGEKFHVWDGQKTLSVFNWEQLLTALRSDSRFDGCKIIPLF
jgi:hypothetical protein